MTKASVVGACILLASTAALGDGWRSIPPGREPLLMTMLGHGAALPGGCRFDGGTNAGFITAEFACGDGRVVLQLRNPDDAPPEAVRTRYFAVVVHSGAPPPGLVEALTALVRAHEAELLADGVRGIPAAVRGLIAGAAAIVLLVVSLQLVIERRSPPGERNATARGTDRVPLLAVVATLAVAAAYLLTRIVFLDRLPVFIDEAVHIGWAQGALGTYLIPEIEVGKWLPIQWMALFVRLPLAPLVAARLASVAMGFATLLACLTVNRELFSTTEGVLGGIVYTMLPFCLFYDRLALADVYVSAFAAWSVFFALALRRAVGPAAAVGLTVCLFATILAKPTGGVLLPMPLLVSVLLVPRSQRARYLKRTLPAMAGGAVFLAFLLAEGYGTRLVGAQSSFAGAGAIARLIDNLQRSRELLAPLLTPAVTLVTAAGLVLAIVRAVRGSREELFLVALLALSFVPYALVSTVWFPRYVVFAAVPVALLAGRTIACAASGLAATASRRFPRAGWATAPVLAAFAALALAAASVPRNWLLLSDPAGAALPPIERSLYVSGWASGYGLPELADFLRAQARQAPINVVRFDQQGPPLQGIDLYLPASDRLPRYVVDPRVEIAAGQIANLARQRRTLFIVNSPAAESPGEEPSTYLGRATPVWSYARPGDESKLEVWEVGR